VLAAAGILTCAAHTRGLDPRVHPFRKKMDCRVKPGNDAELVRFVRDRRLVATLI
jgi:hypothetical protein